MIWKAYWDNKTQLKAGNITLGLSLAILNSVENCSEYPKKLTKIRLKRAFSFGGKGLLEGILVYDQSKQSANVIREVWL